MTDRKALARDTAMFAHAFDNLMTKAMCSTFTADERRAFAVRAFAACSGFERRVSELKVAMPEVAEEGFRTADDLREVERR